MHTQQDKYGERGSERLLTASLPHEVIEFCMAEQMQGILSDAESTKDNRGTL
jgi:hypothetical protein